MLNSVDYVSETVNSSDALSDLLRQIRFRAEVFFRASYCGRWAVDTSGSNQVPFHLVSQGEGWLHSDAQPPRRLLAGHLVLFPHDGSHVLAATSERPDPSMVNREPPAHIDESATRLICGYFLFDRLVAAPLLAGLPSTMVMNLADAPSAAARELVHLWMREAAERRPGSDVAVDRLAELVFIELLRTEAAEERLTGSFSALGDPRLGPVVAAIHRDPGGPHRIEHMAAASNLSESAFTQRFKKSVGMTPGQYVRHWRMQSAARALRESRRSMSDIAASVGYESEVAFRKAFRAYFEQSPGAFRRQAITMASIG